MQLRMVRHKQISFIPYLAHKVSALEICALICVGRKAEAI